MATREDLIDEVRTVLAKAGFAVSERADVRPISFDVVARRDEILLILKVLGNVDALSDRVAHELRTLAKFLHGMPLLVGQRSGAGDLEDGVAYAHRGIPVLTAGSLRDFLLDNSPPLAFATPGGIHVRLNGVLLRRLREERALSLGVLAQVVGVSRRAIQMYEEGMRASVESALRLEEFLGTPLIDPVNPFELFEAAAVAEPSPGDAPAPLEQAVFRMLRTVGFRVVPTQQSPFQAMAAQREETTILTAVDQQADAQTRRRAQLMASLSVVTEKAGMVVVRRETTLTNLDGTPVLRERELERVRDPEELADLLDERTRRARNA